MWRSESGNIAAAESFAITIDTAVPNTPLLDLITDGGTSSTDNITNTSTPTITVTANDTVNGGDNPAPNDIKYRVYDRDGADNEILIIDSFAELNGFTTDGFFQHVLSRLTDGTHNLKLEVEDRAGNISPDFLLEIVIDTQLPTAVTVNLLTASDTGMSSEDNVTGIQQPAFDGLGTVGDLVTLYANGEVVGVGRVGSDETDGVAGNRAWSLGDHIRAA